MTPDEYSGYRPNEAWFTGVLSLLLLVIMRVRLLGHSALITLIRNQERERQRKRKNREFVQIQMRLFKILVLVVIFLFAFIFLSVCKMPYSILWILSDFILYQQLTEESN